MKHNFNTKLTIIGLVIAFGFAALPLSYWLDEFADVWHLVRYEIVWWLVVFFLLAFVRFIEKRDFASIGLKKPRAIDIPIAILAGVLIIIGLAIIFYGIFPLFHLSEEAQVNQLAATPLWWRIISVGRAAFGEEVLFRGYGMERLGELLQNTKIAGLISWIIFTLEHVGPWEWSHLLIAGFGGLVLTLLYLWKRNLWINVITHFIVDGVAVLL